MHTVFFDVGGTLVTGRSVLRVFADKMDIERSNDIFKFLVDRFMEIYLEENPENFYTIKDILILISKEAAKTFNTIDISDQAVELYHWQHLNHDYLYDDTLETLQKLKEQNIKLVLISDADSDVLVKQLKMFDIWKYFDETIISDQTEAYKPDDKVVQKALSYCCEPLTEIYFVGDRIVDIKTAQKMGVKSVLINREGNFDFDADHQITDLNEILSF